MNGRWVKSQKIVKFPVTDFDPNNYIVPAAPQVITTTIDAEFSSPNHQGDKLGNTNGATNHNTPAHAIMPPVSQKADGDIADPVMNGVAVPVRESLPSPGKSRLSLISASCIEWV